MKRLLCVIYTILTCFLIHATEKKFTFSHLNLEDGLSSVSVNDIWLDPTGLIWIATADGLDCFDGNTIVSHIPSKDIHQGIPKLFTRAPRRFGIASNTGNTGSEAVERK